MAIRSSSPCIVDGVIFVGSYNGKFLCALNASSGVQIWSYTTGGYVQSSPAVAGGIVYVGSEDKNMYALNATTGECIWYYATGGSIDSSPAIADGIVFVGSADKQIYAFGLQYNLTVVVNGQGTVTPSNQTFSSGTIVNLNAISDAGWSFSGWSGDTSGSTNTTITMDGNKTVTATFTPSYNLTVMVYLNNTLQSTENLTYDLGDHLTLSASYLGIPDSLYLEHWDLDGTVGYNSSLTIDMTKDYTIKAYLMTKTFQLNITQATGGSTSPTNGTYNYTYGSTAEVTATPADSNTFTHWLLDGEINSTDPDFSIDMYANHTLTAVFSAIYVPPPPPPPPIISYQLTVNSATGGTTNLGVGGHIYNSGTLVTVTASASTGYQFSYWLLDGVASDNETTISVNMNAAHTVAPVFAPIKTQLAINSVVGGSTSPEAATYAYDYGAEVFVTANASTGYAFNCWQLDGQTNSTNTTITLSMIANHTLAPVFSQLTYQLAISPVAGGSTTPGSGSYTYVNGETATVTAVPSVGYLFGYWIVDGQSAGATNSVNVQMTSNHTVTPVYAPITYTLTVNSAAGGSTTPANGVYTYNYGQTATVTAVASEDYRFVNWLLDGQNASSSNNISIQMLTNHTLTPIYAEIPVILIATETTTSNTTYPIAISGGNMTAKQMTNMTITSYASNTTTVVALNVTGPSGTVGTGTIALPKEAIPYGTIPQVYIDGVLAENQTYIEDANYFYVTFTTHFSEHTISIVFASPAPPPTPTPTPTAKPSTAPTITPSPTFNPTANPPPTSTPQPTATPTSDATSTPTATTTKATESAFPSYLVFIFAVASALFVVFALVYRRRKKSDA
jgi:hypothetical protein